MKFLVIALIALGTSFAQAEEVGPVTILRHSCKRQLDILTCRVVTGQDSVGAHYQLSIQGDAFALTPVRQLLDLVTGQKLSVYFEASELKHQSGDLSTGTFEKIMIQPWND